jgi:hypothetical protein
MVQGQAEESLQLTGVGSVVNKKILRMPGPKFRLARGKERRTWQRTQRDSAFWSFAGHSEKVDSDESLHSFAHGRSQIDRVAEFQVQGTSHDTI